MASSETLQIIIRLRDQATRGLRNLNRQMQATRRGVNVLGSSLFSLKAAIAGLGVGLLARQFVQTAASFEAMEVKLDALTKGRGTETLEALNEWALRMPVNTQKAVSTFSMMQAMGLDPTIAKMQTLVDVSVLFGEDAMPRVARALGQMAASGRLSREELNQLTEVGINATKYIEQAFGMTLEQVQRTGVDINKVVKAVFDGLNEEFGGSGEKMMDSWQGLTVTLASYWAEFQRRVMKTGVFESMKDSIIQMNKAIDDAIKSGEFDVWASRVAVGVITAFQMMTHAVSFFIKSVVSAQGIFQRISLEVKEFQLTALRVEFNRLFEALDKGGKEAEYYARIWGEDEWQDRAQKRIRALHKEIQILTGEAGEDAEALYESGKTLEEFGELMEKALEKLSEAKKKAFEDRDKPKEGEAYTIPEPKPKERPKPDRSKAIAAEAIQDAQALIEVNKTLLAELDKEWKAHGMPMEEYFQQRNELMRESYEAQKRALEERLKLASKEEQKIGIRTQLFALRQAQIREAMALEKEYQDAIEERGEAQKRADETITNIDMLILQLQVESGPDLEKQFEAEREKMLAQQQAEIDELLELKKRGHIAEAELNEAKNKHLEEQEQLAANQRKKIWDTYIGSISDTLGSMTQMFLDW